MTEATDLAFAPDEVAAILRHMNGDHGADAAIMCRGLGGVLTAESAAVTGVDRAGMDFEAVVDGAKVPVRLPWGRVLAGRAEVRGEVVRLYRDACAALGIEPRNEEAGQH